MADACESRSCDWCKQTIEIDAKVCHRCGRHQGPIGPLMKRHPGNIGLMKIAGWSALALAFAMVMGCGIGEQEPPAQGLLISRVSIVSPERESIETGSVVIEGDRIRTVSTTGEPDGSGRSQTTDWTADSAELAVHPQGHFYPSEPHYEAA